MTRLTLIAALMLNPAAALALSCLAPDVARSFRQAEAAEAAFVVVLGRLEFDEERLPVTDWTRQQDTPPETTIPARLTGKALSRDGFGTAFAQEITIRALCFGPWCAGARSGIEYLAFLERTPEGHVLTLDPCGGWGFAEPDAAAVATVTACARGQRCEPGAE